MVQTSHELIEALYRTEGKAEIVDGRILEMPPGGQIHNRVASLIAFSLMQHVIRTGVGEWASDGLGYLVDLPNRMSFSPDASYFIQRGELTDQMTEGAPAFAAEVRSPEDYGPAAERRLAAKRADYFAAGTLVVWDVIARRREIAKYRASDPDNPTIFAIDDVAEAEPAVPGWTVPVRDLFPPERQG